MRASRPGTQKKCLLPATPSWGLDFPVNPIKLLSAAQQVAGHIRESLLSGTWVGEMPGVNGLAADLGVNHKTVEAALAMLERDGLIAGQGPRKRKRIVTDGNRPTGRALRIAILPGDDFDRKITHMVEIWNHLTMAGNTVYFTGKTMSDLGMDLQRIGRLVEDTEADAWIVVGGTRAVLEWFAVRQVPAFALFGSMREVNMAGTGPLKAPAYVEAVRMLIALGHRRIVMLTKPQRVSPSPGYSERIFLDALEAGGIATNPYYLPVWENTKEGFHRQLASLFRLTPPTALLVQEAVLFAAVRQFLANQRIRVPEDVSIICADPNPNFAWQEPTVAHVSWDSGPWVRRIGRWAANVSLGKDDRRQVLSKATLIPGGTMGPAPG